jgi:Zn-dependent peptidase ImmA (M78 family)
VLVHQALGSDVSGVLIRHEDRTLLGVNSAHHPRRQRFTIAHELGHLVLHPGRPYAVDSTVTLNSRKDLSSLATDQQEIAANKFAAELLMPERMIRSAVRALASPRVPNEDQILERLAREFEVSVEPMSFRLINLGIRS